MSSVDLLSTEFNESFVFMDGSESFAEILHSSNSKNDLTQFWLEKYSELICSIAFVKF